MNIGLFKDEGASEPGVARLYIEVPIGATGAPGTPVRCRGFVTTGPTRASAGLYTWLLREGVQAIVGWNLQTVQATPTGAGVALAVKMKTRTVSGATPGIVFQVVDAAGAAVDPANGDSIVGYVDVKLSAA